MAQVCAHLQQLMSKPDHPILTVDHELFKLFTPYLYTRSSKGHDSPEKALIIGPRQL